MSSPRPNIHRRIIALDALPPKTVILDDQGHAWQFGGNYWYRAFGDSSEVSSWELGQIISAYQVMTVDKKRVES